MKARSERRRRETATLVKRAQGVMRESRKLLEQREAHLKQMERFVVRADEKLTAFMELERVYPNSTRLR
jgi:hypothetical protein